MSNTAATVRTALKSELGLNSKQVSVCTSSSGSVRVTIKAKLVSKKAVEKVAQRSESVRFCEVTGEILSGGNTFVFVDYEHQLFAGEAAEVEAKLAEVADGETIDLGGAKVSRHDGTYFVRSDRDSMHCHHANCAARIACEMRNESLSSKP